MEPDGVLGLVPHPLCPLVVMEVEALLQPPSPQAQTASVAPFISVKGATDVMSQHCGT